MTDLNQTPSQPTDDRTHGAVPRPAADARDGVLDGAVLMADLLDRVAGAQVALIRARARADRRGSDEALLQMRAAALLLASIPAADLDALRPKVLAAAILALEDDDASSLARRMVEFAIRQDDTRLQGSPWHDLYRAD